MIFEQNMIFIGRHNFEADKGLHTYRLKMNEHGDLVFILNIFLVT